MKKTELNWFVIENPDYKPWDLTSYKYQTINPNTRNVGTIYLCENESNWWVEYNDVFFEGVINRFYHVHSLGTKEKRGNEDENTRD